MNSNWVHTSSMRNKALEDKEKIKKLKENKKLLDKINNPKILKK
jgi:hypothetical protein